MERRGIFSYIAPLELCSNLDPLISIVVPTYNRAHLIGETLETIISQSYKNWECIVVDDGSMDYTKELLMFYCEKEQRIRYHICPKERQKGAKYEKMPLRYNNTKEDISVQNMPLKAQKKTKGLSLQLYPRAR